MSAKNSIDIIFTGLIREYTIFKKSIKDLNNLRKKGLVNKIILSTWKGEPAKHPEILSLLKKNKVLIIESKEPRINQNSPYYKGKDYIWHQMKALEIGLKNVDKGRFLLKSRTDVYIQQKFIEKLIKEKETLLKIKKDLHKGNIFQYKVWVPWFELTKPFFMADECFFGLKEDLQKLYNFKTDYFEKYDLGPDVHHVMRYIDPFLEKYPIFYSALRTFNKDRSFKHIFKKNFSKIYEQLKKYTFLKKFSERSRFSILNGRLKNKDYINLLAAYYSVLYSHFYIDLVSYKDQVILRDFYKGQLPKSDTKVAENNFSPEKVRFQGSGTLYFYELGFINALVEGNLQKTPLSERLKEGMDHFEKD